MTIKDLREKRAKLIADARTLHEEAKASAGGIMTAEAEARYASMMADAAALAKTIEREETLEEERALLPESMRQEPRGAVVTDVDERKAKYSRALNQYLRSGFAELDGEARAILRSGFRQFEAREMNVTTGSSGGYVVAPDTSFYGRLVEAMKMFGGMRLKSTILQTATGADLPMPTNDDTANSGSIVAEEGSHASGTTPTLGQTTLNAYLYSSKVIKVSLQLLQDSAIDIEALLARIIARRIGRATNAHFTTGTGTNQPRGIVTAATLGKAGASGQTTSITFDDILDLFFSVDAAYRGMPGAGFMGNDTTVLAISKIKDGEGKYIWQPSAQDGTPDRLYGKSFIVNNDVASMATSAKSLLFGDLSAYHIRDVQDVRIVRLDELYAENGQVGFLGFSRHDGDLLDAGTHPVKYYQNSGS